ncbi:MAG: AAA family ATPase [Bacteroidota bacterium]|jgi:dephospho-CoA kinase
MQTDMICIGITGTIGAGKGTVVEYLERSRGYRHFSVRSFLLDLIRTEGMPENRDSMFLLGNRLRNEFGPSYVVDCLYKLAQESGDNCIIESIRTTGETAFLRSKGNFYLLAVDADQKIRYERIRLRKSETDTVSFTTFAENEEREMTSTDPGRQNLRECIRMADFVLTNNGSREELFARVDDILKKV